MMKIDKQISIEELAAEVKGSVKYLAEKGIRCIRCGEPIWGTLEEAARQKGFSDDEIARFVDDLNRIKQTGQADQ